MFSLFGNSRSKIEKLEKDLMMARKENKSKDAVIEKLVDIISEKSKEA